MVLDSLALGAKGIVFGRNIWQSSDSTMTTQIYSDFIHRRITIEEAIKQLGD